MLRVLFGLPLDDKQLEIYRQLTGNDEVFEDSTKKTEAVLAVGARGGKSAQASVIALYESICRGHTVHWLRLQDMTMIEVLKNISSPVVAPAILPDGNGGYTPCPDLMTEKELIRFLRIPEVSKSEDYHNVVANLKRMRGLPCIHISHQALYPRDAIRKWIEEKMND